MRGTRPVSPDSQTRVCERLGLDGERAAQAAAFDPFDLRLLAIVRGLQGPTVPKVAALTGAEADQVNISLSRLVRLGLLTMRGDRWVAVDENAP